MVANCSKVAARIVVQPTRGKSFPAHRKAVLERKAVAAESEATIAAILMLHAIFLSMLVKPAGQFSVASVITAPN
eukprot:Skav203446  [mRNA]  locus=scaffold770:13696:13920:- [translate_table: standard]